MQKFTQETIKELREEIAGALHDIEKAYDITFEIGNIRFDNNTFRTQLQCFLAVSEESERMLFEKYCACYGLHPSDYKRTFEMCGQIYRLIGFDTKARKYCYVVENIASGEKMRCGDGFKRVWDR